MDIKIDSNGEEQKVQRIDFPLFTLEFQVTRHHSLLLLKKIGLHD